MVVQVALDVDKRGVALSARVGRPVSFVSPGLMILPNGLLMIRKLTAKNIFHSIGEIVRMSRLIPLAGPAGKIVLCLHRN